MLIKRTKARMRTIYDRLLRYASMLQFGDVHFKINHSANLHAIIAIHSTKLGPAMGGCRFLPYTSVDEALKDALRLSRMMSYKAAISNLPHGGAKAVVMQPSSEYEQETLFEAFGEFVDEMSGRYITAVDSGTEPKDMDAIAKKTKFVTCRSNSDGDPSLYTAVGVRRGIEAAVKYKLGRDDLDGIHVAIQGAGHVGYHLAREVIDCGAKVSISDIDKLALERCVDELNAAPIQPNKIHKIKSDVFSPCALGAIISAKLIRKMSAPIIAGSANNQLAHRNVDLLLQKKGILYAPDFVINAGGLIQVATLYDHADPKRAVDQIDSIYDTLTMLFERAEKERKPADAIAEEIAEERLYGCKKD